MKRLLTIVVGLLLAASAHGAYVVKAGSTSVLTPAFKFVDTTTGVAKTDITGTDIDLSYHRANTAASAKVDAVLHGAITDAWDDGEVFEVDDTLHPGVWRIDWPDAAFADGVNWVILTATVTGAYPVSMLVRLVDYDPQDGTRLGLLALPSAAADAAGGLPISDAGGLALDTQLANTHEITAARMGALTDWIDGGRLDLLLDAILLDTGTTLDDLLDTLVARLTAARAGYLDNLNGHTPQTGDSYAIVNSGTHGNAALRTLMLDVPTVAEFNARTLLAADYFDWTADTVANVTTVATLTGHTAQTGDTFALANGAAGFVAIDTVVDAILVDTGTTLPATLTAMSGAGFITGTDSLEAIRNRGDAAWTTGAGGDATAANQVILLARLTAARAVYLDQLAAAAMPADLTAVLADTNELQTNQGNWVTSTLTGGGIADAVWDELLAGHATAGTAGRRLRDLPIIIP